MSNHTTQHTSPAAPPRYKLAVLSWAGAYGLITLIIWLLGPAMADWPLMLRTLLISVLMAGALTWVVLPALTRVFRGWLLAARPEQSTRRAGMKRSSSQSLAAGAG